MRQLSSFTRKPILFLTAAAFGLRLAYLLHSHPFIDEFTTILASRAILQRGLPLLPSGLFYEHGLLFSYLDAPFVALASEKVLFAVARLPSLLIGTATVPFLYWIGRRWLSARAGLVAAALLAFSPEGVVWGGRARMYALAQLLVLLVAFLVYEGSQGEGSSRQDRWLALLVLLGALLTQLGALILVPPLLVGALIVGWMVRPVGVRPWFISRTALLQGVTLAVVVGVGLLVKRLGQPLGADPLGSGSVGSVIGELIGTVTYQTGIVLDGESVVKFLARQFGLPHHLWLTIVAVVAALLSLALWLIVRPSAGRPVSRTSAGVNPTGSFKTLFSGVQSPTSLLYLWFVFGLSVVEMVILLEPWRRNPRYLVMVLPLFYLIVAGSLEQISNLRLANSRPVIGWASQAIGADQQTRESASLKSHIPLLIFAIVQLGLLVPDLRIVYRTPEPAYEQAFQYVVDHWQTGDVLLAMNTSAAGLFLEQVDYASTDDLRFAIQEDARQFLLNVDTQPMDRWLGASWVGTAADFNRVLNEHRRVWFVIDTIRLPVYYRGDWLVLLDTQMDLAWSGDEALVYFTRPDRLSIPPMPQVELNARFGDSIRLDGYAAGQFLDRSAFQLTLFWSAVAIVDTDYTIFVHLRNADNRTVVQWDGQPLDGAYPTSRWRAGEVVITPAEISLPDSLTPGEYWLYIGLYKLDTLTRLPLVDDVSGENAVIVGPISMAEDNDR
jgi:4-amino-4-deoxy-L-arabinose transferase-like glycosyltransferase